MKYCTKCGAELRDEAVLCPSCGVMQPDANFQNGTLNNNININTNTNVATKSRFVAAILAFLLGGIGIHKFYCGKTGTGILYLLFCWTGIPAIIAFVEFIIYLVCPSDEEFTRKHCR